MFLPTARHIWDTLQTADVQVKTILNQEESIESFEQLQVTAEQAGKELFDALREDHKASLEREEERGKIAFESRRKAIERIGLPEVRQFRLSRCEEDESEWKKELAAAGEIVPEIRPLLLFKVEQGK